MTFAKWMATGWGRAARILAGLVLIAFGLYLHRHLGDRDRNRGPGPVAGRRLQLLPLRAAVRRSV